MAFVFTAAYLAICSIAGGLYVSFPHIYHGVRWLQYLSILKYGFQVSDRQQGLPMTPLSSLRLASTALHTSNNHMRHRVQRQEGSGYAASFGSHSHMTACSSALHHRP